MIALALAVAAAQPLKLHTYKDWIVGCDNVRTCQANALYPKDGADDFPGVTISRRGAPGDAATLELPLPDKPLGVRFALTVDGAVATYFVLAKGGEVSIPLTQALITKLSNGKLFSVIDAKGVNIGGGSLAGFVAVLLYIDDQQKRVGTVGALKATGPRPSTSVPVPPAPPLIVTPPPSTKPPRTISVALATQLIGPDNAKCDYSDGKVTPRAYRLDATHSLVLIDHPCGNGAYNYFTSVYVLNESGPPRPAKFDIPPGMVEAGAVDSADLTNGDWDPKSRQLGSYEKGRGLGDCGTTESYAWDGARFRLIEQDEMDECRGSVDFIRTWTARTSN